MAESVRIVAQVAEHLFYQNYKPASAFLRLKHFVFLVIAADSKLKKDEYDGLVALNLRKRMPNAQVILSSDNFITVDVDIVKEKAVLPYPIMSYSGAEPSLSVSQVKPHGNCGNIMPTSQAERWQAEMIKDVPFWLPVCDGIEFINLERNCNPSKVKVTYVPQLTKKSVVQESRKWAILNMINLYVKSAKEGVIIDMSNDGNSNVATQTEINKYLLKALQK